MSYKDKQKQQIYNRQYHMTHQKQAKDSGCRWRQNNRLRKNELARKRYADNRSSIKTYNKLWRLAHKDKVKKYGKQYRQKHAITKKIYDTAYRQTHKTQIMIYAKKYRIRQAKIIANKHKIYYRDHIIHRNQHRISTKNNAKTYRDAHRNDLQYKLSKNLRIRLVAALKRTTKTGSAVRDLGCTIAQFKIYLESLFQPFMTWNNYGKNGWHIDHIRPLSSFRLEDREQFNLACHYTNLQPLWAHENFIKNNKYIVSVI